MIPQGSQALSFAIAGAGGRGRWFAQWLHDNIGPGAVVAIAEPKETAREKVGDLHGIALENRYATWQEMLAAGRHADILINTTMDREHVGSAVTAMRAGYHLLLEKPLATSLQDAIEIDRVRHETNRIVSVCHSLRYHAVYEQVAEIIASGAIGKVVSLDQLEAVEHIHQSHSFVRGNWGNSSRSTFMLLAKSCHDIDIIASLAGAGCERVSSFGSLTHFRADSAPEGAPAFCVDGCPAGDACPYHAMKIYGEEGGWQSHAGFNGMGIREIERALRTSPYGRCVYRADNDVVDHQVVSLEFADGVTGTFTMTAFTPWGGRYIRVHGTHGYLEAKVDQRTIDLWEFWRGNRHTHFDIPDDTGSHGGGDDRLMRNFLEAVVSGDASTIRTGTAESVRTHAICFAAEQARVSGEVVTVADVLATAGREPAALS